MTIRLDHTIVPARDKAASAEFFADIFGLEVDHGFFARVQVNESLTLAFTDEPERWGNTGYDPETNQCHHYAFHVSDKDFERLSLWERPTRETRRVRVEVGANPALTQPSPGGRGNYWFAW